MSMQGHVHVCIGASHGCTVSKFIPRCPCVRVWVCLCVIVSVSVCRGALQTTRCGQVEGSGACVVTTPPVTATSPSLPHPLPCHSPSPVRRPRLALRPCHSRRPRLLDGLELTDTQLGRQNYWLRSESSDDTTARSTGSAPHPEGRPLHCL